MAEAMHTEDSDADEEDDKAMIEQIKRDSLKQLEEAENKNNVTENHNISVTDIFYEGDDAKGFFLSSGKTYIYPTNYPIRDYQRNIVHSCLFENTLVSLPTGLGKTFIAAVVMYNFYRWYPRGKIVFMAPTRPLVSQQMRACYDIMGIPMEDTIELQGNTVVAARKKEWNEKRVFYVTPQTIDNDLKSGVFNPEHLKCLVIDEAHRATKNYAYCQVVQQLREANIKFRVIALSATPGREIQDVINLIQKLGIAKLELRSENSIDIVPYTHTKKIDSVQVPLSDLVLKVREEFLKIIDKYTRSLKQNKVLVGNTGTLTKFLVMVAKDKYVKTKAQFPHINRDLDRMIQRDFHVTHSLASALENLTTYGLRAFYNNLVEVSKEDGSCPILGKDNDLQELLQQLKPKLDINIMSNDYAWSHLKFIRLQEILETHFKSYADSGETTKVIIFANFRVVVAEIYDVLKSLEPMVKASMFVGQSSGVTQQEQKEIMRKFREGEFNTLIATSVGEEGLDIGEIDLVICFDSQKSPIKLVQRLGRTGRKRNGRCVFLLTQGREAQNFTTSMQTCKSYVEKIINNKSIYASLAKNGPRMIPAHVNPTIQCLHIVVKERKTPAKMTKKKAKELEKANKKSKQSLDLNRNSEVGAKSTKTNVKKSKKQPVPTTPVNDIRTCFENIAKKKKTFVDFFTQSSGEPAPPIEEEVVIVQDQLSEFEQMFAKITTWAEECANKEEFILNEEFFDFMDNFMIDDADETPVDVMDVDELLDTEDRMFCDMHEGYNLDLQTNATKTEAKSSEISTQQRPKSPDLSNSFAMDFIPHVFSPYEQNHNALQNQETPKAAQCVSPIPQKQENSFHNNMKGIEGFEEEILDDGNDDVFLNINSLVSNVSVRTYPSQRLPDKNMRASPILTKYNEEACSNDNTTRGQPMKRIDEYFPFKQQDNFTIRPLDTNAKDCPLDSNILNQKPTDNSIYQSVDELFASDEEATPPLVENNNIRSYFVSEHEIKDCGVGEGCVEPMSIWDLFEDSPEDEDNENDVRNEPEHQNYIRNGPEKLVNSESNYQKNQNFSQLGSRIINDTPGRNIEQFKNIEDGPCASTPMIPKNRDIQANKTTQLDKQVVPNDNRASPDLLEDIFAKKNAITTSSIKKASPFTPKQKMSQFFQSPDVSEIKSQAIKSTAKAAVKINLESKFNSSNTRKAFPPNKTPENFFKTQNRSISPSCEIIFDSDSDEDMEPVVAKVGSTLTSLDGSNMFTVTQLVDMACERERKLKESLTSHVENRMSGKAASHEQSGMKRNGLKQNCLDQIIDFSPDFKTCAMKQNLSNKENLLKTSRKLDGMDIVDTSDDDLLLDCLQSSQTNDKSLIHSYVSTRHLAQTKPKLPQGSVLSKLSYVEENQIIVDPILNLSYVQENQRNENPSSSVKQVPNQAKPNVNHSSSDEDFEFFIPKRNPKKDPLNAPKSPLLLSKVKSKPKLKFQKPGEMSCNSNAKKNATSKLSNLSLEDSAEQLDHLIALGDEEDELFELTNNTKATNRFVSNEKTVKTTFPKPSLRTPFISSENSKLQSCSRTLFTTSQTSKAQSGTSCQSNKPAVFNQPAPSTSKVLPKKLSAIKKPPPMILNRTPPPPPTQPSQAAMSATSQPAMTSLETEFGGMTDAQFEEWLKNMNKEENGASDVNEPSEPVTSQYFQSTNRHSNMPRVQDVLMGNRAKQLSGLSQRVAVSQTRGTKSTLTKREKENFNRVREVNVSLIDKSNVSLNNSIHSLNKSNSSNSITCISSEDDDDLYFFRTTGNNDNRTKPVRNNDLSNKPHINTRPTNTNFRITETTSKPISRARNDKNGSKKRKNPTKKKSKKSANPYIEVEADVSVVEGEAMSSDDDLTNSSEDEMDSSFIDDEQERDETMAVYLKSVRSPSQHGPANAKFKIPVLSDTVLDMDVYSQAVAPDRTEYLNDSFCVSDEAFSDRSETAEASLLELAEARLEAERKMKKKKGREGGGGEVKQRRRVVQMISSSDEE
uniref:Fanconi anemia group M protein n=1 Tax=Cacopsylla melanoneura TaxID=428564 RepID=A0A8D9AQ95_9HEMI